MGKIDECVYVGERERDRDRQLSRTNLIKKAWKKLVIKRYVSCYIKLIGNFKFFTVVCDYKWIFNIVLCATIVKFLIQCHMQIYPISYHIANSYAFYLF